MRMQKKRLVCFFVICILMSAGCGKKKADSAAAGSVTQAQYCYTEEGLLLRGSGRSGKMEYFDYQTKNYYLLCGEPNCLHNSQECTAVYLNNTSYIGRLGDNWYYLKDDETGEAAFYCCSLDGKNEKRIGEFPHSCGWIAVLEDDSFFTATEDWFIEEETGEVSEKSRCGIYRYDLDTGKEELLVPEKESGLFAYTIFGKYQDQLVYGEEVGEMRYELRILDLETKEVTNPLEGTEVWWVADMSENLLACNVRDGELWKVIELDVGTGQWKEIVKDRKGTTGLFWSEELKLLHFREDSEGEYCTKTYRYQEDGTYVLIREDREEYYFSPLVIKNDLIVGHYRGGNWQEGINSELAVISREDYLAGKTDFIRLEY